MQRDFKTETGHQQACEREEFEVISELKGGEEEFYHLNQSKKCGALELGKSLWNFKASFINQCHNLFWRQLSKMNKFPHFSFQGKFFLLLCNHFNLTHILNICFCLQYRSLRLV